MRQLLLCVWLLLLLGCAAPEAPPEAQPETPPTGTAAAPADTLATEAPLWSREGLETQPRLAWLQRRAPAELGHAPATTSWRPAPLDLPADLTAPDGAGSAAPDALLSELIRELELAAPLGQEVWEQTLRIWQEDDEAIAVLLQWGLQDDAVAGQDIRIFMRRSNGRWYAERIEERFHCSRGVTEDGLCV